MTSDVVAVVAGVLAEHGPMTEEQLVSALAERGLAAKDDVDGALAALGDGDGLVTMLADDRWASLPALLAGRMFTHRLTGSEVEHDFLDVGPDLDPVGTLTGHEEFQRLVPDGSPLVGVLLPFDADVLAECGIPTDVVGDSGALLLPPGCLRGRELAEGDMVALRITDDGLVLDQVTVPERAVGVGELLSAVLAAGTGEPMPLSMVVWTVCADDPALFADPLPPLGEVLAECGLVYDSELLAPQGFDFRRWRTNARRVAIAQRNDLDERDAVAVLAIVLLYERVVDSQAATVKADDDTALSEFMSGLPAEPGPDGRSAAAVRMFVPMLAAPTIAEAVLAETIAAGADGAVALGRLAESLEPFASREARPALRWLRGKAHERLGDVTRAEAEYQAAESLDPKWPLALVDLARYASDRGDAARGLALLRRVETPPDPGLVELLERFQVEPRSDVGRNDPCWCGSGRKYKKCHLHREQLSLEERAVWLYQKAVTSLADGPWGSEVLDVAKVRAQYADSPYGLLDAMDDPLVTDVVLFEGGVFEEFVTTRGALLPADERLLAGQWLLVDRSVYEVEQVRPGEGYTLRDLRTGDVHPVRDRTVGRQLKPGALICTRVVPAGDTEQILGGIEPVESRDRDELIALLNAEPDPVDLVSLLTRRFAPPALTGRGATAHPPAQP